MIGNKKINWLAIVGYPTSTVFVGMCILIVLWLGYPYRTTEIEDIKLLETEVQRGQHIHYSYDFCDFTDVEAQMSRRFEDGLTYHIPETVLDLDKGCENDHTVAVYVPKALPAGIYHLEIVLKYKVNPIREEYVKFGTEDFEVVD